MNKIIAVDFDGTIVGHCYPEIGKPVPDAIRVLKRILENGHKLILWTMRSDEKLKEAEEYLKKNNIELFGINCNPTQSTWTTSKKQYAHVYIDDAALGCPLIEEDLEEYGNRPYVDWQEVESLLVRQGLIEPERMYSVNYSIDVEAGSFKEAAEIVEDVIKDSLHRPSFTIVNQESLEFKIIDLKNE